MIKCTINSLNINRQFLFQTLTVTNCRVNYAKAAVVSGVLGGALKKKSFGKLGAVIEKRVLPVETDAERLVSYACGANIYKIGEDIKLKPNNEYPDWLWKLRLGPPLPLEEIDPNSKEYWRRVRRMARNAELKLRKVRKF